MHTTRSLVLSCLIALTLAACAGNKTTGETIDDSLLHSKVKTALVTDDITEGFEVNLEVYKSVVQVSGFVESDEEVEAIGKVISGVGGVESVRNRLVVEPRDRRTGRTFNDSVIAGKVKARIGDDPITSGFSINVEVRFGVVLLSGWVDTDDERKHAITLARGVSGVVDVADGMDLRK